MCEQFLEGAYHRMYLLCGACTSKYEAGDSLVKLENIAGCPWNLCGVSVECSIRSFSQKKFIRVALSFTFEGGSYQ